MGAFIQFKKPPFQQAVYRYAISISGNINRSIICHTQSERLKASNVFTTNSGKSLPTYLIFSSLFVWLLPHQDRKLQNLFLFTVIETPSCKSFWLFPDLSSEKNFLMTLSVFQFYFVELCHFLTFPKRQNMTHNDFQSYIVPEPTKLINISSTA